MKSKVLLAVIADRSGKDVTELAQVCHEKGLTEVVKMTLLPIAETDKFMQFMADFGADVAKESVSAYQQLAKAALQRVLNEHFQMSQDVWEFFSRNAEQLLKTDLRSQVAKVTFVFLESIDEKGNTRRNIWGNSITTPLQVRQFCQNLIDHDDVLRQETLKHVNVNNWRAYRWMLHNSINQSRLTWRELFRQLNCGIFNFPLQIELRRVIAA